MGRCNSSSIIGSIVIYRSSAAAFAASSFIHHGQSSAKVKSRTRNANESVGHERSTTEEVAVVVVVEEGRVRLRKTTTQDILVGHQLLCRLVQGELRFPVAEEDSSPYSSDSGRLRCWPGPPSSRASCT